MTAPRGGRRPLVVGVTGHRALPVAEEPALERAVAAVFSRLQTTRRGRPILLISPCAEGADRLVARVGLAQGWPLLVLMPMPRRLYERDFIALWNGKASKKVGGTAQIVEFRRASGGPMYHVLAPNGEGDVLRRAVGTRRLLAGRRR